MSLHSDVFFGSPAGRKPPWSRPTEPSLSRSPSIGSIEVDHTEEDFNRDELARATGFIGKTSEVNWLQKLSREVNIKCEAAVMSENKHAPSLTPQPEGHCEPLVASLNYYLDDLEMPSSMHVDAYEVPPREVANQLFNAYLASVHPSFPIVGISTFVSQFQVYFKQPSLKPGDKWLAILNLIFAIGSKYAELTDAEFQESDDDHSVYFSRARILSLDDQLFQHSDLQQLQVEGLASFYLLASGHVNRYAWQLPVSRG